MIINKKLELSYNLSFGVMSKWLSELTKGKAIALKCSMSVSYTHLTLPTKRIV